METDNYFLSNCSDSFLSYSKYYNATLYNCILLFANFSFINIYSASFYVAFLFGTFYIT